MILNNDVNQMQTEKMFVMALMAVNIVYQTTVPEERMLDVDEFHPRLSEHHLRPSGHQDICLVKTSIVKKK